MQRHAAAVQYHVPAPQGSIQPCHVTPRAGTGHGHARTANARNTRNSWPQPAGGCLGGFPGSLGMHQSQFLTTSLLDKLLLEPGRSLGKPIYYFYYCLSKSIPALSSIWKVLWVHMEEIDPGISKFSLFRLLYVLNNLFGVSVSCVRCYQ